MPSPKGDPTYIKNKDRFFLTLAKTIEQASSHPIAPGGCVLVRDREVIGDGRSFYTASQVEVDCLSHAIATAAKRGTPTPGAVVYTTRYPFSHCVFQCYVMGIRNIYFLSHDWETRYKDEFKRAARLARELAISIEPISLDDQYSLNTYDDPKSDPKNFTGRKDFAPDEFDVADPEKTNDFSTTI